MKIFKPGSSYHDELRQLFQQVAVNASKSQFNWSLESIEDELQQSQFLVLEVDERLVSFISYRENEDSVEIMALGTDFNNKGQGYMLKLLTEFASICRKNLKPIFLEVHAENLAAIKVYTKVGFKLNRIRSRYYSDGKDALVYRG